MSCILECRGVILLGFAQNLVLLSTAGLEKCHVFIIGTGYSIPGSCKMKVREYYRKNKSGYLSHISVQIFLI
jgi:hypothetical protein